MANVDSAQLRPVDRANPAADPAQILERHLAVPADVKAILDRCERLNRPAGAEACDFGTPPFGPGQGQPWTAGGSFSITNYPSDS